MSCQKCRLKDFVPGSLMETLGKLSNELQHLKAMLPKDSAPRLVAKDISHRLNNLLMSSQAIVYLYDADMLEKDEKT